MGNAQQLFDGIARAIGGDRAALEAVASPDIEFIDTMQQVKGVEATYQYLTTWAKAFPDARIDVKNVIESGDQAAGEMAYRGTQTGAMASPQGEIPPTGKSVELHGGCFITISGGKITSFRGYYDGVSMMSQLGLMPAPATA